MKHTLIFLPILLLFFCGSCKKKKDTTPKLPDATQTGANTFGCKVNGDLAFTAYYYNAGIVQGVEYYLYADGTIDIYAITKNPTRRDFTFTFKCMNLQNIIGTHEANKYVLIGYSTLDLSDGGAPLGSSYYQANDSLPSTVTITKFTGNVSHGAVSGDILSGTFDFQMKNADGTIIHLTEGRFDIKKQ